MTRPSPYDSMKGNAFIEGDYRYWLHRVWNEEGPAVCWIMLNPSTADAEVDDATIRRCIGFTNAWGYGKLCVVNLFALRSRDPRALAPHPDPVGPLNDEVIERHVDAAGLVVAAWGTSGGKLAYERARQVVDLCFPPFKCLGTTRRGHPLHPLYLPSTAKLEPWALPT